MGVGLHSVTENLDLSSATGRMFYNILGTFAQFFGEQLAENVRMGTAQAVREGRWVNRPKTGYSLVGGLLEPNEDAPRVREVFRLRAEGHSYRAIEERTGITYSTVKGILDSRIYLGEVLHNGSWFPGAHEPLVTLEEYRAAHQGHVPGRRRGSDLLWGKVRCGVCAWLMAVETNGEGRVMYRCRHRGKGRGLPRRVSTGLQRAALLGMKLVGHDKDLQAAIRRQLGGGGRAEVPGARRRRPERRRTELQALSDQRRKLLELHYRDQIGSDLFAEEEHRLQAAIAALRDEDERATREAEDRDELSRRFEEVAALLATLDVGKVWSAATPQERRVLAEELVEEVVVLGDHLEVKVTGTPRLNVLFSEVGLKESQTVGVGGGT